MKQQMSIENCFANVAGADLVSYWRGHVVVKWTVLIENGLPEGTPNLLPVTIWGDSSHGGHLVVTRSISIEIVLLTLLGLTQSAPGEAMWS